MKKHSLKTVPAGGLVNNAVKFKSERQFTGICKRVIFSGGENPDATQMCTTKMFTKNPDVVNFVVVAVCGFGSNRKAVQ